MVNSSISALSQFGKVVIIIGTGVGFQARTSTSAAASASTKVGAKATDLVARDQSNMDAIVDDLEI